MLISGGAYLDYPLYGINKGERLVKYEKSKKSDCLFYNEKEKKRQNDAGSEITNLLGF